ncbi:YrdB family protein [Oceanobacillus rekensis]|uniref:YrdB family protein n=1 Tax=Oceanobacillus rekensis TaxID=937927 RepID=UPI001592E091|nr:YrdB family protein [Oceanobacillus rekensis]
MIMIEVILFAFLFLFELAALAAFSYWGFNLDKALVTKIIFGIGTPLLITIFWGLFIAPKASHPVADPLRTILQILIFSLATTALYFSGKTTLAITFLIAVILNIFLVRVLV